MLEGKQLELSKHLKELSQRNDQVLIIIVMLHHLLYVEVINLFWRLMQAINEIRRKYEKEKVEISSMEKEKVCGFSEMLLLDGFNFQP